MLVYLTRMVPWENLPVVYCLLFIKHQSDLLLFKVQLKICILIDMIPIQLILHKDHNLSNLLKPHLISFYLSQHVEVFADCENSPPSLAALWKLSMN